MTRPLLRSLFTMLMKMVSYFSHHDEEAAVVTCYSIPYARAARFELPTPIDEAEDLDPDNVVNASVHGPACINFNLPPPYDEGFNSLLGSEPIEPQSKDCLTMDVSVPDGHHEGLSVYCESLPISLQLCAWTDTRCKSTHPAAASLSAPPSPTR